MKICPICNREFKQLTAQHIFKHNLDIKKFKENFPLIDLGNDGTKTTQDKNKQKRIEKDNIRCKQCNNLIIDTNRKHKKFCTKTCAAIYNNNNRILKGYTCLNCHKIFTTKGPKAKFCCHNCSSNYRKRRVNTKCNHCNHDFEIRLSKLQKDHKVFCNKKCRDDYFKLPENKHLRGTYCGWNNKSQISTYRKLAFKTFKHECCKCGFNEYPEILQVHHKDMNRKNNIIDNLEIKCPNCHALTHLGLTK